METHNTESQVSERPYRLGIALSGGGARGFAHAGALQAIEEAGLKPDVIAGVSAGSVVAVLYAAGLKPSEILQLFVDAAARNFMKLRIHNGGLFSPRPFGKFIMKAVAPAKNLEDLTLPVYLGVTDFDNVCPAEFHTGDIESRMLASCSIPLVFPPVQIGGVHYVDGGMLRNHPAWIIRDRCDYLIGVNCSPMPMGDDHPDTLLKVALRSYHIMLRSNQFNDMAMCDLSIETPEISNYKVFDLKNIQTVFTSGYMHTRRTLRKAGLWTSENISQDSDE